MESLKFSTLLSKNIECEEGKMARTIRTSKEEFALNLVM